MAEDTGGPHLPRRVPGTKRGPGTGPLARPVLSDSDLQRIRAALDSAQAQAPAPPAERPALLPRRVRNASKANQPSAHAARPELPAALLPTRPKKAPTEPAPAVPPPRPGEVAEETGGSRRPPPSPGPPPPRQLARSWSPRSGPQRRSGKSGKITRTKTRPARSRRRPAGRRYRPSRRTGRPAWRRRSSMGPGHWPAARNRQRKRHRGPRPSQHRRSRPPRRHRHPHRHQPVRGSGAAAAPSSPAARSPRWSSSRQDQLCS